MSANLSDPGKSGVRQAVRPTVMVEQWLTTLLHGVGSLPLWRLLDVGKTVGLSEEEVLRACLHMQSDGVLFYHYGSDLVSLRPLIDSRPWLVRSLARLFSRHPGPCCFIVAVFITTSSCAAWLALGGSHVPA